MKEKQKKAKKTVSKSLAVTMIAGITFLFLFVYGAAGFLLFQYFRENPESVQPRIAQEEQHPAQSVQMTQQTETNDPEPPLLIQPEMESVTAYTSIESPLEKSMEQIASLKRGVVLIEAGDSQGSGVVISAQGHVVTNFHVVESSPYMATATIDTVSGELIKRELMLLGYDIRKDLALLQFKNTRDISLQPLPLGSIGGIVEGQRIVAIGSPRGLMNTISDGIVSGIRKFDSETYVQISAPISPGNSGGALLNMKGELIGLTTFKITESENLNFAISADDVKALIDGNPHWINP